MSKQAVSKQTILITGATSGIGQSLANAYIAQGQEVVVCGRNAQKLQQFTESAAQLCLFDITDRQQVKEACQNIGQLDLLILNAGDCLYIDNVLDFDHNLFEKVITTNLISISYLLSHLTKKINPGGRIVFISSSATILPFPRSEAYGASKAGLDYLANSLRLDLVKQNIKVTLVHPGFIKTPLTDRNDFNMPFIISSDEAAYRIITGLKKGKEYLHFPKRLTLLLKLLSFLPNSLWQKLMLKGQ